MINHHSILKEDLKRFMSNINKKYTTLRKQVLKTMEVFENEQIPVFPYEVCFGLFRQISETASLTASLAFFPFLQNIINLGFGNSDMSREILTLLHHTKSIPKFQNLENQTKMQSIVALLVSKNSIDLTHIRFTHSLFNLILSLENCKYRVLWLKSCTILYQTTLLLTNQIRDEPLQDKIQIFETFLSDLVTIIRGEKVQWLIEIGDPYIILQIFSQILDEKYFQESSSMPHQKTFYEIIPFILKEYRKTIQLSFIPQPKNQPFSSRPWQLSPENKLIILTRVGCKINIITEKGYELIEEIIKLISDRKAHTLKVIGYEGVNYLFRHTSWMLNLLQSEYTELFNFFLTTEFNLVKSVIAEQKDRIDLCVYFSAQDTHFGKIMGTNAIELGLHQFTFSHQLKIIIKSLEQITYGLYAIYGQKFKIDLQQKMKQKPPLERTYKFCQKTIFEIIKSLLSREMTEDTLQSLLKISQKFINLSGCFQDSSVSTHFIKLMCKYCLPAQFKSIGHRHIQINKMILNTANCLGHLFTSSCWVIVWKALENYSIYYNRYLLGKEELESKARESDIQILYHSMDSIFTETPKYDDGYLLEVLRSLIEVAYECLENNYNDESRKIFAFERIEQVYKLNLHRICIIWPELSSSLLCITTSKVLYFRISALSLLNTLIPLSLNYLKNHEQVMISPFETLNYESLILEPWMNLVSCQFQQIKDQLIVAVNKLIIAYGHIMTHGWKCILEIVKKNNDLKSLQSIVEIFLQKIHDNIMDVLTIVDNVERKLSDTNQKFQCLNMIWAIGDYAHKNGQGEVLKKIYQILLVPEEMFDLGTEARQSSFYIFAEILVHNCAEKSQEFWIWIFNEIKKFYQYGITECLKAKDKQFAEEAVKNLVSNLIKVYKKFFIVSKDWEKKETISMVLGDFYSFCGSILRFRSTEIYQSLLKQIKEVLLLKLEESLVLEEFNQFLQSLTEIYYIENDNKLLKCLITYLPADIFDLLSHVLGNLDKNFCIVYKLSEKIFLLRLEAIEKEIKLQQLRIFFEEKYFYEMMRKVQGCILDEKKQLVPIYVENLVKTIHKLKLYEDYQTISKFLPFLTTAHLKYPEIHSSMTLEIYKKLTETRIEQIWLKNYGSSKDIPIWYISSQDLLKIADQYLQEKIPESINVYTILKEILQCQQIESKVENEYTKDYQCHHYENQMSICNFLIQNYFFQNNGFEKEIKVEDIRKIAELISKRSGNIQVGDQTRKGLNAYQILFKVCGKLDGQVCQGTLENQAIMVENLFERIFKALDTVKSAENSEQKLEELRFTLKKMQSLELEKGILRKIEQKLSKKYLEPINFSAEALQIPQAHLFYFQPLLSKCIRCKDQESLTTLQQIFNTIAKIILRV